MKGEIINFGEVSADKIQESTLIGLENDGKFELHEIVTKIEENNKASVVVCRSFLEPDKIKTLSFWTDLDKSIFIPEKAFTISDFVMVSPRAQTGSSARISDLSGLAFSPDKVAYFAEKQLKSGKYKFVLMIKATKTSWTKYIGMSGSIPYGVPITSTWSFERVKKSFKGLDYVEKQV